MARVKVRVKDVEAEVRKSGNSLNFVRVEQAAAAAAGLVAIAVALTGGLNIGNNDGGGTPAAN